VKYKVILADPPWQYQDKCTSGERGAGYKYDTLPLSELLSLRIADIADDDCALFLWVTAPFMRDGIRVLKSWGFEYKTMAFTWMKTNNDGTPFMGMGNYTRGNAEFVLLGIKGKPKRVSAGVRSAVLAKRRKHSAKPPEVRGRIGELFGNVPRVELFARDKCLGWDQTGIEMDGLDIREFLDETAPVDAKKTFRVLAALKNKK